MLMLRVTISAECALECGGQFVIAVDRLLLLRCLRCANYEITNSEVGSTSFSWWVGAKLIGICRDLGIPYAMQPDAGPTMRLGA